METYDEEGNRGNAMGGRYPEYRDGSLSQVFPQGTLAQSSRSYGSGITMHRTRR